jgi:hypothetical protein
LHIIYVYKHTPVCECALESAPGARTSQTRTHALCASEYFIWPRAFYPNRKQRREWSKTLSARCAIQVLKRCYEWFICSWLFCVREQRGLFVSMRAKASKDTRATQDSVTDFNLMR